MDDYFIEEIDWDRCTKPINAIDFSVSFAALNELVFILEVLGLSIHVPTQEMIISSQKDYLALEFEGSHIKIVTCGERIAPIPTQYINTLVPALILAHLDDPKSVKHVYNDFFINKKEEITPLLNK